MPQSATLHCGLATASLLGSTLVCDLPTITDGKMLLPQTPGLGVTLDPGLVQRYAFDPSGEA
jgi:L-alanine-DL-glutamate epimerase-like enolase superfamily enzyme